MHLKIFQFTIIFSHLKFNGFPQKKISPSLSIDAAVNGTEGLMEIGVVVTDQGEFKFMAALVYRKFCTSNVEFVELKSILERVKEGKDVGL